MGVEPEGFIVGDTEGPLSPDEVTRASSGAAALVRPLVQAG